MNNNIDKELKKYFRQIKLLLPFYNKNEHKFIRDLKEDVYSYIDSNPNCTIDDIFSHFETPAEIVYNYISSLDQEYLAKKLSVISLLKKLIVVILILTIISYGLYYHYLHELYLETKGHIIKVEEIVIEE